MAGTVAAGALADPSACILHLAPNAPNATAWGAIAVSAPAVAAAAVETFGWPVPCRALPPALLQSYERLEFLGDSVLGLAGRTLLMRRCPDSDEVRGHGRKAGGVLGLGPLPNCTALHPSPPPNLPSTHQPLRCAAQGVMTRQNNLLVSGVSNAGYAEFLGLDRYLLIDAKGFRCVHTHAHS